MDKRMRHSFSQVVGVVGAAAVISLILTGLTGCRGMRRQADSTPRRAVYYWRTTYAPSAAERDFIETHHIGRMYLRYFDVVENEAGEIVPNATLRVKGGIKETFEVVPVVFVMENALRHAPSPEDLGRKIGERIKRHHAAYMGKEMPMKTVQIDCDYTGNTRERYEALLRGVRQSIGTETRISATIRLHNLRMPPPAGADEGTLMLYNTGDITRLGERNVILDSADAKAYLRKKETFGLAMGVAYPIFEQTLKYRNGKLEDIVRGDNDLLLRRASDSIVHYESEPAHIRAVKQRINQTKLTLTGEVVIYPLDEENLKRYSHEELEAILQ